MARGSTRLPTPRGPCSTRRECFASGASGSSIAQRPSVRATRRRRRRGASSTRPACGFASTSATTSNRAVSRPSDHARARRRRARRDAVQSIRVHRRVHASTRPRPASARRASICRTRTSSGRARTSRSTARRRAGPRRRSRVSRRRSARRPALGRRDRRSADVLELQAHGLHVRHPARSRGAARRRRRRSSDRADLVLDEPQKFRVRARPARRRVTDETRATTPPDFRGIARIRAFRTRYVRLRPRARATRCRRRRDARPLSDERVPIAAQIRRRRCEQRSRRRARVRAATVIAAGSRRSSGTP